MRAATLRAGFAAFIIVILVAAPQAQQTAPQTPAFGASGRTASPRDPVDHPTDVMPTCFLTPLMVANDGPPLSPSHLPLVPLF